MRLAHVWYMVLQHQIKLVIFINTDFYWTTYLIEFSFSVYFLASSWAVVQMFVSFEGQIDPADSAGNFLFCNTSDESNHVFRICFFYFILVQIEVNFTFCLVSFFILFWLKQRLILLSANSPFFLIPIFLATNPRAIL